MFAFIKMTCQESNFAEYTNWILTAAFILYVPLLDNVNTCTNKRLLLYGAKEIELSEPSLSNFLASSIFF